MQRVCSSDYITAIKRQTLYKENKSNAVTQHTVNPVKKNGFTYNNKIAICLPKTCVPGNCTGGVVTAAQSYALLQDYNFGHQYNQIRCACPAGETCYLCVPCALT